MHCLDTLGSAPLGTRLFGTRQEDLTPGGGWRPPAGSSLLPRDPFCRWHFHFALFVFWFYGRHYRNKAPCQRHSKHGCTSGGPVLLFTSSSSKPAPRGALIEGHDWKGPLLQLSEIFRATAMGVSRDCGHVRRARPPTPTQRGSGVEGASF